MNPIFLTGEKTFIKDIIHDSIELSPIAKTIIDTPIFQRLRYLHQLGVCYLIFPNANNNRFEHSIGTYHLTGLLLEKLIKNSDNKEINKALIEVKFIREYLLKHFELDDTEENIKFIKKLNAPLMDDYLVELIKIAGLIHDVGHGPFSHLFDEWLISLNSNGELDGTLMLEHESRSIMLLREIITDRKIKFGDEEFYMHDFINEDAFNFIAELIDPTSTTPTNFIFQIISNSLNGLDVDKLDYLYRDSFYLGIGNPYDLQRVISHVQVIGLNICFPEKISYDIYKVFRSRYDLHKQYYTHKTTICIEYMIRDILYNLNPILKISNTIKNNQLNKFIELTDSTILDTARILKEHPPIYQQYKKRIDLIQHIINKINTRDIYRCVYSETFYTDENITNEQIFNKFKDCVIFKDFDLDETNFNLNSSKLKIIKIKIGLLGGNKSHPLDTVYFYNHRNKSIILDKTKISHLMTSLHQEVIYYVIYKT
jgi:deoxynucleoside triphosphate triphosphohydrolase SAMHD1